MDLIIDTDIGRDPDDFFTLLWFISCGVNIRLVTISPGDKDQVAICNLIRKELNLDFQIGVGRLNREGKTSSGGIHYSMLKKYGHKKECEPDGYGPDLVKEAFEKYPNAEVFVCGPPMSIGEYLKENDKEISKLTMQGGFLPYYLLDDHIVPRLEKFENQTTVPTFNMNGDVKGTFELIEANVKDRRFVGKNVCHTIVYNKDIHRYVRHHLKNRDRASQMFVEAMDKYLKKHNEKKFHDPAAAVSHLYPEVFKWVKGTPYRKGGKWGTDPNGDDLIAASVHYNELWSTIAHVTNRKARV